MQHCKKYVLNYRISRSHSISSRRNQRLLVNTPEICHLYDREGKAAQTYNAGARTLYLVRPDRHIAARCFDSDLSQLPMYLRHAMGQG